VVRFPRGSFLALAGIVSCGGGASSDGGDVPLPERDLDGGSDATVEAAISDAGSDTAPPADAGTDARVFLGCNGAVDCQRAVFVTSKEFAGNFGGIDEADKRCQSHADGSQSPRVKNHKFVAWVSTANNSVSSRLVHGTMPYVLPSGAVVANDWSDLTDGTLDTGIALNEDGADPGGGTKAWTGTTLKGDSATNNCNNWKDTAADGRRGNVGGAGNGWSDSSNDACTNVSHLYCFEY